MSNVHVVIQSSITWDFLWQGHQIRAVRLAQQVPVTFIETTGLRHPGSRKAFERLARAARRGGVGAADAANDATPGAAEATGANRAALPTNLRIVAPVVLPPTSAWNRAWNRRLFLPRLAAKVRGRSTLPMAYLTYLPTQSALDLRDLLRPAATIYHCLLNFEAFPDAAHDIAATERRLVREADRVIVDSNQLLAKHGALRPDVLQILPGVDFDHFHDVAGSSRPFTGRPLRATFFGGMAAHRFDWTIVRALADAGIEVHLLGPIPGDADVRHPNVVFHGAVPYARLPTALEHADVLILPYRLNEFTQATFPVKLFQCFATGKPVVSTPLPDVLAYADVIDLAADPGAFVTQVAQAVERDTDERRERRVALARRSGWDVGSDALLAVIRELVPS